MSFLYYMGYLTIQGESRGRLLFGIPNLVIKELYWEYFDWLITQREQLNYDEMKVGDVVADMTEGNLTPFLALLTEVSSRFSDKKIAEVQKEVREQILKYVHHDESLRTKQNLLAYTLVFVKNEFLVEKVEV